MQRNYRKKKKFSNFLEFFIKNVYLNYKKNFENLKMQNINTKYYLFKTCYSILQDMIDQ